MSTTVGPPLPPQILVVVITLDDSTYSFSTTETCMRKVDEYVTILLRELGRITVDTHDLVFTTGPPPHVSTLRIEEVIRNPSAPPFQRVVTLYILPRNRPGAPDTVNKALAQSASPSEFADVNVFSQSQKEANTRLVDGFFIHNQKQLNASLACVPTRFFYDGFLAAAKDLRRIKTEDLEELKVRANKLFGGGKIVEGVVSRKHATPDCL
ncbi:hypothetical protein C8F01DRAFT_1152965 [Mycena amicta]|nr:hypothetical protein C8F01DRAFT_1152965 [Mycena amicta]